MVTAYKDGEAKSVAFPAIAHEGRNASKPDQIDQNKTVCGSRVIVSDCSSNIHHFAKRLVCGREWCSKCGKKNSAAHKRRLARILPKVQQLNQVGYLIIEFPDAYRKKGKAKIGETKSATVPGWCYNKTDLRSSTNTVVEVLAGKRLGGKDRVGGYFDKGLIRWHWFGEKRPGKWNPHMNVLVRAGYIRPKKLKEIKEDLRSALNVPDLIVRYLYVNTPGAIVHKAKYITRPTFTNYNWSPYMVFQLDNFRNQRWWGKWYGVEAWPMEAVQAEGEDVGGLLQVGQLQTGICPDCAQPLKTLYRNEKTGNDVHWTEPIDSVWLAIWGAEEIAGSGFYRISDDEYKKWLVDQASTLYRGQWLGDQKVRSISYDECVKWLEDDPPPIVDSGSPVGRVEQCGKREVRKARSNKKRTRRDPLTREELALQIFEEMSLDPQYKWMNRSKMIGDYVRQKREGPLNYRHIELVQSLLTQKLGLDN